MINLTGGLPEGGGGTVTSNKCGGIQIGCGGIATALLQLNLNGTPSIDAPVKKIFNHFILKYIFIQYHLILLKLAQHLYGP